MSRFAGKTAIVTGAASGIGRATALMLAKEGASVGMFDVVENGCESTLRELEQFGGIGLSARVDIRDSGAVDAFVNSVARRFGALHVVINNAGVSGDGSGIAEISDEEWGRVLDVNLSGHFYCCRASVPWLEKSGGGAIVTTSSVLARATLPGTLAYATSKAALIGFTTALALELGPKGIRVNALLPGSTDTPMLWQGVGDDERPSVSAEVASAQPLLRYGRPSEIARAALFLASDEASFVTGASLVVDGGLLTRIATTR